MNLLLLSALATALVTAAAAWGLTARWPGATRRTQVILAALSFPALAILAFVAATIAALVDGSNVREAGGTTGMVIFALFFFLVYALVAGALIGLPTAILAVRAFRKD